jgi:hypothetical protein
MLPPKANPAAIREKWQRSLLRHNLLRGETVKAPVEQPNLGIDRQGVQAGIASKAMVVLAVAEWNAIVPCHR